MLRVVQCGGVLLLAAATGICAQNGNPKPPRPAPLPRAAGAGRGGQKRLGNPGNLVERLIAMPPEKREQVLEKLPPGQQANLRNRLDKFDKLPPEEKAWRLEMLKTFEGLPPEKQDLLDRQLRAFNGLPEARRQELGMVLQRLRRLPESERGGTPGRPFLVTGSPPPKWRKHGNPGGKTPPPKGRTALPVRHVGVEHLLDFALADCADALFHHLAALEEQQGGDAADVVAHGGAAVGVHIQLADLHLTGVLAGHGIDRGPHLPARAAPLGPKIHQNRNVRAQHVLIERRIGKA